MITYYSFSCKGKTKEGARAKFSGIVDSDIPYESTNFWDAVNKANNLIDELSPGFIIDGSQTTANGVSCVAGPDILKLKNKPKEKKVIENAAKTCKMTIL